MGRGSHDYRDVCHGSGTAVDQTPVPAGGSHGADTAPVLLKENEQLRKSPLGSQEEDHRPSPWGDKDTAAKAETRREAGARPSPKDTDPGPAERRVLPRPRGRQDHPVAGGAQQTPASSPQATNHHQMVSSRTIPAAWPLAGGRRAGHGDAEVYCNGPCGEGRGPPPQVGVYGRHIFEKPLRGTSGKGEQRGGRHRRV